MVCTWNPRQDYLQRTLDALARQTLPAELWELVVVDNHSSPPVAERGFAMPGNARLVLEAQAGLTSARLRGIAETRGEMLVFVDDDNLLAPDYLEVARRIAAEHPKIGVFGGRSLPEFEAPPPEWMKPFWPNLALHDFDEDQWTNRRDFSCFPCGAGMCIRRDAANRYVMLVQRDSFRKGLDRSAGSLSSGGDTDIVLETLSGGWGVGRFKELSLLHIIPAARMSVEYHCRLAWGMGVSIGQLNGRSSRTYPVGFAMLLRGLAPVMRARGPERKVRWAAFRAYRQGLREGWAHRCAQLS